MFKKKCSKCNSKVGKDYDFCPYCGHSFRTNNLKEEYGFLGKNDNLDTLSFEEMDNTFMDRILENAMKIAEKMIEKQMRNLPQERPAPPQKITMPKQGNLEIQFFVNGKRVSPQNTEENPELIPPSTNKITKEKAEKFSKYPKKEPISKVRRFSGKVIYEMQMPEVKKIDDIFINQLEDSIEIKALGKDKVYSKTLNINLPILGYKLEQGNLILELAARQ